MLLPLALAIATTAPAPASEQSLARPAVQARATVRIIAGAAVRFGAGEPANVRPTRETVVYDQGIAMSAKLVEFE